MVIVPSVDVRDGRVGFRSGTAADVDPLALARRFVAAGARELHLVDLDHAEIGEARNLDLLTRIAAEARVPCRLAGGMDSVAGAREALAKGFAGVLFSSAVFGDDRLLAEIARLGAAATVEIEAREGALAPRGGDPALASEAAGRDAVAAARDAVAHGVVSLYVIDLSTEARLAGPPLRLIAAVRAAVGPDVALHTGGGIRDLDDIRALARGGVASAVVGRALAEGRFTIAEAGAAAG